MDYLPEGKYSVVMKIEQIITLYDEVVDYGSNNVKSALLKNIGTVLIFCHNRSTKLFAPGSNPNIGLEHWLNDAIYDQAKKAGIVDPTQSLVKCVDVKAPFEISDNVITADAFSDDFTFKNEGLYNVVAIPDCAGIWWNDGDVDLWVSLINKASIMLVSGGTLFASKFVSSKQIDREQSENVEDVASKLRETGQFEYVNAVQGIGYYYLELKKL
jgi:hypothetical protein